MIEDSKAARDRIAQSIKDGLGPHLDADVLFDPERRCGSALAIGVKVWADRPRNLVAIRSDMVLFKAANVDEQAIACVMAAKVLFEHAVWQERARDCDII